MLRQKGRAYICAMLISLLGAAFAFAGDNVQYDYLQYETLVRCFWNDDILATRDTVLIAVSIKKYDGRGYRVLPLDGKLFFCDAWKPVE